jgi:exopolysaccharide production protein ExoQ
MPKEIALFFCTIFVLFLLRLERKQSRGVSFALWIPTIWMLIIASKPWSTWLGWGYDAEGSYVDQIFLGGLFCLGLIVLVRRRFSWSSAVREHPWLVLVIGYMFASVLWSGLPFISFKRWIRELVAVVMAFVVLTERDPRHAVESVLRRTIYVLIPVSVLLIKYYPEYGVQYAPWSGLQSWVGVTLQKNGLGRLCLVSIFFLVWTLVRRWRKRDIPVRRYQTWVELFLLIVSLVLLKGPPGAYSATAVGALAVGLACFFGLLWLKKQNINLGATTLMVITALIIIFGTASVMVGGSTLEPFTSTLGRDETLTGRTDVWASLFPAAMREPILGFGFGGFWTRATREMFRISEAHNGYLEVILELGFVGLFLFSMFLLSCGRKAHRALAYDFDWGALWVCYLLMAVLHNVAESSLSAFTSHLTAVLMFLTVSSKASSNTPGVTHER